MKQFTSCSSDLYAVAHRCAICELKTESDSDLQIGYGALDTRVDYAFPYKSGETVCPLQP